MSFTICRLPIIAVAFTVCVLHCVNGRALHANLLLNPGFETGDFTDWTVDDSQTTSYDVALDGTVVAGDVFGNGLTNVRSGDYSAYALVQGNPVNRLLISQTVSVTTNQEIEVGFFVGRGVTPAIGAQIADTNTQIFFDGVGLLPDSNPDIPFGTGPEDFLEIGTTFNTQNTDGDIVVTFALDGGGSVTAVNSFDDFYFRVVPEPSSFILIGLGGLVLLAVARRRRK